MTESEFTSNEQQIIEQLHHSPAPTMNQEAVERLRQQLFDEVDQVWGNPGDQLIEMTVQHSSHIRWLVIVLAVILLLAGIVLVMLISRPGATPVIQATATVTAMQTSASPTNSPLLVQASPTAAASTTPPATPSETPVASLIVIEGPVSQITDDYIIIFDQLIETDRLTDVTTQLTPGVLVRVEGEAHLDEHRIVISAVQITVIQSSDLRSGQPGAPPPSDSGRSSRSSRDS